MNDVIGKPIDRVDGKLKVTGHAKYSAEFSMKDLAYGVSVQSTIARGRIASIDTSEAEKLPGVLAVMTYRNAMSLHTLDGSNGPGSGKLGEKDLLPLQNDRIFYDGQHVAIAIAETFQQAEYAASLVKIVYKEEAPVISIEAAMPMAYQPMKGLGGSNVQIKRGDPNSAMKSASITFSETYSTPVYHHNPMEPHATIAVWNGDELTLYDSTQAVLGSRNAIAAVLGAQPGKVRLVSLFIGGGFGCKGFTWPHSILAPMAAKLVNRPVKLVLNRQQMFTSNGRRSKTIQQVKLGADHEGKLTALQHISTTETSFVDEFIEPCGIATKLIYDSPGMEVVQNLVRLNKGTPCPTRAPGEATGTYALECAMDELAYQLKMDPIQLRILNHADKDPQTGKAWSSKNLKECYERGAAAIGWANRKTEPGAIHENGLLAGYGMSTAIYPANRMASSAKLQVFQDGHAVIYCATQDIGTGTYTILTQVASEALGIPVEKIVCKLGDSDFPKGPNSGGSQTAASASPAVWATALTVKSKIIKIAIADKKSPLYGTEEGKVKASAGKLINEADPTSFDTYSQVLSRAGLTMMEAEETTNVSTRENQPQQENKEKPNEFVQPDEDIDRKKYTFSSFGAQFAKVLVDPYLGTVRVVKCASCMDIGKVLNYKTAKNQIMGGIIFGIGMALMEGTVYDLNNARVVTRSLADYLVPVHADMPEFDIQFIDKPDPFINPMGARGIGEIGITGITAAIVNAIYNATGKRVRDLPVTPDKLI